MAAPKLHITNKSLLIAVGKLQHSISPHVILCRLERSCHPCIPEMCCVTCVLLCSSFSRYWCGWNCTWSQGLWTCGCSYLSIEGDIYSVLPTGQPLRDPYYNVTYPCPPFNADPLALVQLLIHSQAELHVLHLVIDTESDNSSSSSLPGSVSFCFNTPTVGGIPLCLSDDSKIVALQVCPCLWLYLFNSSQSILLFFGLYIFSINSFYWLKQLPCAF